MFAVTREQQDAAYVVIQQEEARVQAEADAASAKRGAAEAAYRAKVASWLERTNELLDEGNFVFGSDQEALKMVQFAVQDRASAMQERLRDEQAERRQFYAGLSIFGACFYALTRGIFLYAPLCVLVAIFLELSGFLSIYAITISCGLLVVLLINRFYWIRSMKNLLANVSVVSGASNEGDDRSTANTEL